MMEPLRQLLQRVGAGEGESFRAATVLSVANDVARKEIRAEPQELRAISLHGGVITVQVNHGTVAGLIRIHEKSILSKINSQLRARWGTHREIERFVTRVR